MKREERPETSRSNDDDDDDGKKGGGKRIKSLMKMYRRKLEDEFEVFPRELLLAEKLDLHKWSFMIKDEALKYLANVTYKRSEAAAEDAARKEKAINNKKTSNDVGNVPPGVTVGQSRMDILKLARSQLNKKKKLLPQCSLLNIHEAPKITDVGLQYVGESCSNSLRILDIGGCRSVTDAGIRFILSECKHLVELNLSDLPQLEGSGFISVGGLKSLKKLNLSRCTFLKDWLLVRIAQGCQNLTHLDLVNCIKITPQGIKQVSHYCRRLVYLNLNGVKGGISDQSLLAISSNCRDMAHLEIETGLGYLMTDVGVLAMAERCVYLRELNFSHCSNITDAGISWLAQHCHSLEVLNLSNCVKITDVAMRVLSEGCGLLRKISVDNAKRVTDVGVRYLAMGCKVLSVLELRGLVFLTDGVVRDFGKQGLQLLAEKRGETLTSLNITGVFQVGEKVFDTLGKYCKKLDTLVASRCPLLNSTCIRNLTCSNLTRIDLSHNIDIDDDCLHALSKSCKRLRVVNLTQCETISDRGVVWLVRACLELSNLNLEGCTLVSDLALLAMSETKFHPGLRRLNFTGLDRITETGVTWLAQTCSTLLSMNLKGCTIAHSGLSGLRESWSHLRIRNDRHFFGLVPDYRAQDKRSADEYFVLWRAAVTLQGMFRMRDANRQLKIQQERYLRHWSTKMIQARFRGRLARRANHAMRAKRRREIRAALLIQSLHRRRIAMRRVDRRRRERYRRELLISSRLVQRVWRGYRARKRFKKMLFDMAQRLEEEEASTRTIQRVWRGFLGRQQYRDAIKARKLLRKKQLHASILIQKALRCKRAREERERRRVAREEHRMLRDRSARKLQRIYRGHVARERLRRAAELRASQLRAACKLQSAWRSKVARDETSLLRAALQMQRMAKAAVRVQSQWRARQGRLSGFLLRRAREMRQREAEGAARTVQRWWRGYLGRKIFRILLHKKEVHEFAHEQLLTWAAVKMQSAWRGNLGRKYASRERLRHANFWKVLFDEDKDKPFYYNKHTGEIRWRMPQPLLDLLEVPICGNCEECDAIMECKDCGEFYCDSCYSAVHYGGKRKKHAFRALFDYYGKRIDYGETEYPSMWPSELQQDEHHGWCERPLSAKQQLEVDNGEWSKIEDEETGGEYYHNYVTNTTSWERPKNFSTPRNLSHGRDVAGCDWIRHYDTKARREYYYNKITQESKFERPAVYATPRPPRWVVRYDEETGDPYYADENAADQSSPSSKTNATEEEGAQLLQIEDGHWAKYYDEGAGKEYYYNWDTGESTYDRPDTLLVAAYDE